VSIYHIIYISNLLNRLKRLGTGSCLKEFDVLYPAAI